MAEALQRTGSDGIAEFLVEPGTYTLKFRLPAGIQKQADVVVTDVADGEVREVTVTLAGITGREAARRWLT